MSEPLFRTTDKLFTELLFENLPGLLFFYDAGGKHWQWNRNFETVSGYGRDEIAAMHPLDFFRGRDQTEIRDRIMEALEKGESATEAFFIAKGGTATPYYFTGHKVSVGSLTGLVGMGIDISARKRADEDRLRAESKYRELVENANSIILRWNSDGIVTYLNEYGQRFFGYAADEIIGSHVVGTIVPFSESGGRDLRNLMTEICANPKAFEQNANENIRRNGERVWIAWTNKVSLDAAGKLIEILSIGTDITERMRSDEARRKSELRYRTLFERAPDGILIADPEGRYLDGNPSIFTMLGYAREELLGKTADDIVAPEEFPNIGPALDLIKSSPGYHREWRFRRKDGSILHAEVIATTLPEGDILALVRDISERKRAELESEMRHRAEAADRVKSAFLATMSHELRTPLNSIIGFTGILLQGLAGSLNDEQKKQLDMVRGSSRHLLSLVNDVLDLSKIEAGQLEIASEPFDAGKSIAKAADLVRGSADRKGLALRVSPTAVPAPLIGDERRFEQILINLMSNAIKFTDAGSVTIEGRLSPAGDGSPPRLRVTVADTGIGIRPADLAILFQPFRQIDTGLTRKRDGTGLGLAISRRLAGLMGGAIEVESEWGKGSVFTLILPAVEAR
jgi:PAS domain S-box-containing protein